MDWWLKGNHLVDLSSKSADVYFLSSMTGWWEIGSLPPSNMVTRRITGKLNVCISIMRQVPHTYSEKVTRHLRLRQLDAFISSSTPHPRTEGGTEAYSPLSQLKTFTSPVFLSRLLPRIWNEVIISYSLIVSKKDRCKISITSHWSEVLTLNEVISNFQMSLLMGGK